MATYQKKGNRRRPYRVFVSHATADKWIATVLCEKLDQAGAATFRDDRDLKGGDDIPEEIRREMIRCDELVVLMTPVSVARQWVILEIGMAFARKRRISVILCHVGIDPIPHIIKSKKAYDLNDVNRLIEEIVERAARKARHA